MKTNIPLRNVKDLCDLALIIKSDLDNIDKYSVLMDENVKFSVYTGPTKLEDKKPIILYQMGNEGRTN